MLALACALCACTSAEKECAEARVTAQAVWRAHIETLEHARTRSVAAQANARLELNQIEPKLSDEAAASASARYDRSTDAWQRAFVAAQSAACGKQPRCAELRALDADAREQQEDLTGKLVTANAVLGSLNTSAERARSLASALVPQPDEPLLAEAKKKALAMFETCKDVPDPEPKPK